MTKDECVRFTMRLPVKLRRALEIEANEKGVSVNALVLSILWDWVKTNKEAQTNERTQGF